MDRPKHEPGPVPPPPEREQKSTLLTSSPLLLESLKHFAAWHGRALTREIEVACEVHVARSMIDALNWPTFRDELEKERPDLDLDAFQAEQESHLRDLQEYALHRPMELDTIIELLP